MLTAEGRVETDRSSRYLIQLCRHVEQVAEANPRMQARVEWSEDRGTISFEWGGRCTLRAYPDVLTLRAEAPDEESLQLVEQRVADRLERFGRHDRLRVVWSPPQGQGEQPPSRPSHAPEETSRRPSAGMHGDPEHPDHKGGLAHE